METEQWSFRITGFLIVAILCSFKYAQAQEPFITTWQTDLAGLSDDHSIAIPLADSSFYEFTVEWGDGSNDEYVGMGYALEVVHTYASPGTFSVQIGGVFPRIRFNNGGDAQKILSVDQWGDISWQSFERAFQSCSNLHIMATDAPDLSNVTSLGRMFDYCSAMNESLNHWDVSNVTNLAAMFAFAPSYNQPLDNWDVSNVTTMSGMFSHASSFNQPLETWDVSNATDMSWLFFHASSFNQPLNSWQVSNVTNMHSLFSNAISFNQPLNNWDVSNVSDMTQLFYGAQIFNQPLNSWQVGNVTQIEAMFQDALSFNQPLDNWDVSGVTNINGMTQMFTGAIAFNQPLNAWDVSNVTRMRNMFRWTTSFNQPLDNWDVSSVENMQRMFEGATAFDQSLGSWEISSIQNMSHMLDESGMSYCNYDSTLLGWAAGEENNYSIQLGAGGVQYTNVGAPGRQLLIDNYGWMITGDELVDIPDFTVMYEMLGTQITVVPSGGIGNFTFSWSGPNEFVSTDSSIVAPENGQYFVVVSDGCQQWSHSFDIVSVEVSNYAATLFQPYPNPSRGLVRLNTNTVNIQWILVFDMTGTMVHKSTPNHATDELDLRNLESGMYIVNAVNKSGVSIGEARIAIIQ